MTDVPIAPAPGQQSLRVGEIAGESFSIMFGNFFRVLLIGLLPMIVLIAIAAALFVPLYFNGTDPESAGFVAAIVAIVLIYFVISFITTALIVRLTYDAKIGNPLRLGSYFASALSVLGPLIICSLIVYISIVVGLVLLIVPGLYIWGMWICVMPVIVLEGAGLGALSRSASLTSGYRWACVGALIVMFFCLIGIGIVLNIAEYVVGLAAGDDAASILGIVLSGISNAFGGIFVALLYARLREIKEGTSVEQLADVFA